MSCSVPQKLLPQFKRKICGEDRRKGSNHGSIQNSKNMLQADSHLTSLFLRINEALIPQDNKSSCSVLIAESKSLCFHHAKR